MPAKIHSAHSLRDPRLSAAVEEFLGQEAMELGREMAALAEHGPFHREHSDDQERIGE